MRALKIWWLKAKLRRAYREYMEDFYEEFFVMLESTGSPKQAERCANWATITHVGLFNILAAHLRTYGEHIPYLEECKP